MCKNNVDVSTTKKNMFWIREFLKSKTSEVGEGDTSVQSTSITCASCDEKVAIEAYCGTCEGPICSDCVKAHKKPKELRCHDIQPRSAAKEKAFEEMAKLTQCNYHTQEKFTFYCDTCCDLVCDLCVRENHKNHTVFSLLTDNGELKHKLNNQKSEWFCQIQEKRLVVDAAIDEHLRFELNINKTEREKKMEVLTFEKKFKEWIDKTSREALETLTKKCDEKRAEYRVKHSSLKKFHDKLVHVENFIESIESQNYLTALLMNRGFIKTKVAEMIENEVYVPVESKDNFTVNFLDWKVISSGFTEFLKNSEDEEVFRIFKGELYRKLVSPYNEHAAQFVTTKASPPSVTNNTSEINESNTRPPSNTSQKVENSANLSSNTTVFQRSPINTPTPAKNTIPVAPKTSTPIHSMNSENLSIVRPLSESTISASTPVQAPPLLHKTVYTNSNNPPVAPQNVMVTPPLTGYTNNCCNTFANNGPTLRPPPSTTPSQLQSQLMGPQQPMNSNFTACVVCLFELGNPMPFIKCENCLRWFHYQCHIPQIEMHHNRENWKCILCSNLNIQGGFSNTEFSNLHKLFCSRLLLRLVSQLSSIKVRCQMLKLKPPQVPESGNMVNLDVIKARLWSRDQRTTYKNVIQFIVDVKSALETLGNYNADNQTAALELKELEAFFQRQVVYDMPQIKDHIGNIFKTNYSHLSKRARIE
ncbi:E3 ubiquitin-protein ligase TRIM33-like protein [Leptotrombidium deliense]|uniref:E3 ubiquitin-protein ligase TRIM33-like protein n=1 Tax=Leptotrombidium deliense TaxID=299467 RepID=A0A443SDN9_9ACAR|nr:E3 ubiquitin-protein ligase TRIM33-like protein [Leptotrombidium deliense]